MRSGRAADDARPSLQRAECGPTAAVLIEMASEKHLTPRRLVNLGDLPLGCPLAPGMEECLSLGIEACQQTRRADPSHCVESFHEALLLGEHAELIGGCRQRDADSQSSIVIGLDFGFHALVLEESDTKVQI